MMKVSVQRNGSEVASITCKEFRRDFKSDSLVSIIDISGRPIGVLSIGPSEYDDEMTVEMTVVPEDS
jgi:hypothetical protein